MEVTRSEVFHVTLKREYKKEEWKYKERDKLIKKKENLKKTEHVITMQGILECKNQ